MSTTARGLTLIEVLIAIVIVGIIAAVALPTYENFVTKNRRADGKLLVTGLASRSERFFLQNNTYTTDIAGANGLDASATSPKGHYTAAIAACASATPAAASTASSTKRQKA